MFFEVLALAIIIGYLIKGKLKNFQFVTLNKTYLVFLAFMLEAVIVISLKNHVLTIGIVTFILDVIMYAMLFAFIYFNRKDKWIILMGIGFLLNAFPIFFNGGAMPVSQGALEAIGLESSNLSREGLYTIINNDTKLWFLGDIIPKTFLRNFAVSIGDIVSAIGLFLFIITGMTRNHAND